MVGLKGMYDMYSNVRYGNRQIFPSSVGTFSFMIELTVSLACSTCRQFQPWMAGGSCRFCRVCFSALGYPYKAENWINAVGFLPAPDVADIYQRKDFINPAIQNLPTLTPTPDRYRIDANFLHQFFFMRKDDGKENQPIQRCHDLKLSRPVG
jgi:hypothetical protein